MLGTEKWADVRLLPQEPGVPSSWVFGSLLLPLSWRQTPPAGAGVTAAESSGSLLFPLRQNSGFWEALCLGKSVGKGWCMAWMLRSLSSWLLPGHSDFSSMANQSLIFPNTSSGLDIRSRDFPINMVDVKTLNWPYFWNSICSSYVIICMYPCYIMFLIS